MVRILVLVTVIVCALASTAGATSLGPNCTTCFGNVYTLQVLIDPDPPSDQVIVTYTVDTAGARGRGNLLQAIAFKVSTDVAASLGNAILFPPSGDWSLHVNTDLGPGGCDSTGATSPGTVCVQTSRPRERRTAGDVLEWQFRLEVGPLLFDPLEGEVKALFVNGAGKPKALTSEPITIDFLIVD
jgi:hypothetical protein